MDSVEKDMNRKGTSQCPVKKAIVIHIYNAINQNGKIWPISTLLPIITVPN
ncbi:MAG: hypothetical protein ACTS8Y_05015 [Arsenophonus sp. ER-EMS1-MAG3]